MHILKPDIFLYIVVLLTSSLFSLTTNAEGNLESSEIEVVNTSAWQGFYLAGSYGLAKDSSNLSSSFTYNGGGLQTSNNPIDLTKSTPGIQFGYNHQINSYIFGIEADVSPLTMGQAHCARVASGGPDCGDSYWGGVNLESKSKYKGSAKLRLGYQLNDFMVYVNGGLAYASTTNKLNIDCPSGCTASDAVGFNSITNLSKNLLRFTYGFGGEYMIDRNWRLGLDYSYFRLPDLTQVIVHQATYGPEIITSKNSDAFSQLKLRLIYSF